MDSTTNALNWFEIPALDIERSKKFYETIFDIEMTLMDMGDEKLALFPFEPGTGKASGAIATGEYHKPSDKGTFVYLNANPTMDNVLAKVEAAGGKILQPKFSIGENGFVAYIQDTEGSVVGIHSMR
ncbi:VOC family protein [Vicingus serpentipes]|uniref:VOC family protein n=1 Tax=Vicingus serpentipes TaxID=1926625 RepID=A0A5C6RYM4_9FLAO|nr:VOC family protein [Vicingus serpentipes]TXB66899.1 VOC family protein [Vicingus serpentipes]